MSLEMRLITISTRYRSLFLKRPTSCLHSTSSYSTTAGPPSRILISTSRNIYENLALEDWLYENGDLENQSFVLMWHDEPCVVVGRHQNPWLECNVPYCEQQHVKVTRRKSGGGTVYHDEGNVNYSFITKRSLYNRQHNLQLVVDALKHQWNVPLTINDRDDIIIYDKYKISGTAAKLARTKAYHHFTLLFNTDKTKLSAILHTKLEGVKSNATQSVRMSVANLCEHVPSLDFPTLVHTVADHYTKLNQNTTLDHINPVDENLYPGVCKHYEELLSWEWIYVKTPPFSIHRHYTDNALDLKPVLDVTLDIKKGCIADINVELQSGRSGVSVDRSVLLDLTMGLQEVKFARDDVTQALSDVKLSWIAKQKYDVDTHRTLDWIMLCVMETTGLFIRDSV